MYNRTIMWNNKLYKSYKIIPEYNKILKKQEQNIEVNNEEKLILQKVNNYVDLLKPICEKGDMTKPQFISHIRNSL